jgi:hypothetical protein
MRSTNWCINEDLLTDKQIIISHKRVLKKLANILVYNMVFNGALKRFQVTSFKLSPRRYPYFDVVMGLVWSHNPKSYAGGGVR